MSTTATFRDLEQHGWTQKASDWDTYLAKVTNQAIDPILESFGNLQGQHLLDIACGTGHLSGSAAKRGANCSGVDFAPTMIEIAQSNYPDVAYRVNDATQLAFEENAFDAVACSFGILHVENPEDAIREAFRVLKSGGKYSFTAWRTPQEGGRFFEIVGTAVQQHADLDVALPPSPPFFRFADIEECKTTLKSIGFVNSVFRILPLTWEIETPEEAIDAIHKGAVRTPMIIERQQPDVREKIHQQIINDVENHRKNGVIELAFPAILVTADKP